jgi:hypothetical protein
LQDAWRISTPGLIDPFSGWRQTLRIGLLIWSGLAARAAVGNARMLVATAAMMAGAVRNRLFLIGIFLSWIMSLVLDEPFATPHQCSDRSSR